MDKKLGGNFIPCDDLRALFGLGVIDRKGLRDCRDGDFEGHGTWVASRIAGALNGFASNGVAPGVRIGSYKVLAAGLGGPRAGCSPVSCAACSDPRIDVVNMSIEGYIDPPDEALVQDFLLFTDAVDSLPAGTACPFFAAAGNEHVRVDRVSMTIGGRHLEDVGQVSTGAQGIAMTPPRQRLARRVGPARRAARARRRPRRDDGLGHRERDRRRAGYGTAALELPRRGARTSSPTTRTTARGSTSRLPGGARAYEIPAWDGGPGDILAGTWGLFGAPRQERLDLQRPEPVGGQQCRLLHRQGRRLRLAPGHLDVGAERGRRRGARARRDRSSSAGLPRSCAG